MAGASSSSIRAGAAFVELYVKDNMLTRGLKAAGDGLSRFGKFADGVVGRLAGMAGVVATPMAAALKEFTDLGKELVHGSARLGTTVEELDSLNYAAEIAGVGADTLEASIVRMNRAAAASPKTLAAIGIDAQKFADLSVEDKLGAVADALGGMENHAQKTNAAMKIFGRGGAALLPMLEGGAEGLKKAQEEARRLGLVMSGEDAQKAAELGKAFTRLKEILHRTFVQLGAALLPVFEKIHASIERQIGNAGAARNLIRNNQGIILSVLQVAKTVLKGAAAWYAFKFAMGQVSTAGGLAKAGLTAVLSILGLVLTPLGLVVAAVAGLAALFIAITPDARKWAQGVGGAFDGIGERAQEAWDGIKGALRQGDLGLAARIAGTSIELEFARVWKQLRLGWSDLVDFFGDGWDSFVALLEDGWNSFADVFEDVGEAMTLAVLRHVTDLIDAVQQQTKGLREWLGRRGIATFQDVDTNKMRQAIDATGKAMDAADKARRNKRDKDLVDDLDRKREERKTARGDVADRLDKEIADLTEQLKKLLDEARGSGHGFIKSVADFAGGLRRPNVGAALESAQKGIAGAEGTFSGFADARSLGLGKDVAKEQLDEAKKQTGLLEEIRDGVEDAGVVGP